jgi:hypothetical protein
VRENTSIKTRQHTGRAVLSHTPDVSFGSETTTVVTAAIDAAWMAISPEQQSAVTKSEMAALILRMTAKGERDLVRLRTYGVLQAVAIANQRAVRRMDASGL